MLHKYFYTIFLFFSFLFFSFLCLTPALAQTVVWDESVDGDLPGTLLANCDNSAFQTINLVNGDNRIIGEVGSKNYDSFEFTVPASASVTAYTVSVTFESSNTQSYYETHPPSGCVDGVTNGFFNSSGFDFLPSFGGGPLGAGTYGLVLDEFTPNGTIYQFSITLTPNSSGAVSIPTISEWGLIILALLLMTLGILYLVQPDWRGGFEQER
mgnify:CR=1 FL=1